MVQVVTRGWFVPDDAGRDIQTRIDGSAIGVDKFGDAQRCENHSHLREQRYFCQFLPGAYSDTSMSKQIEWSTVSRALPSTKSEGIYPRVLLCALSISGEIPFRSEFEGVVVSIGVVRELP